MQLHAKAAWGIERICVKTAVHLALLALAGGAMECSAAAGSEQVAPPGKNTRKGALQTGVGSNPVAETDAAPVETVITSGSQHFLVNGFKVKGDAALTNATFSSVLQQFTGTNVSLTELVGAASELERAYSAAGYTNVTLTLGRDQIMNGVVILNVFRGAIPQIVVEGRRCLPVLTSAALAAARAGASNAPAGAAGNAAKVQAHTKAPPGFPVRAYAIRGDTLLSDKTLTQILAKYTGTNVTVGDIVKAGTEMQMEYRNRGYPTVKVIIPPQKIDSNAIVQIQVLQGRLAEVNVVGNRYFSSNNVMRALPSLQTNTVLVEPVLQSELDRANANQDRQIYAELEPGPTEGTTALTLRIKDRLPLHAKVDFNNQNSPGTPDLRVNTSAVYNNLWQLEHSVGVQYAFSPTDYKSGNDWNFYDEPLVANYGGFYRLPLGSPSSIAADVSERPGTFGYSEATRRFQLPPPSGQAELSFFGSRSTIDNGLNSLASEIIYDVPGVRQVTRQDVQEDVTITEDLGWRLNQPLKQLGRLRSGLSMGFDYKNYDLSSNKTNRFGFTEITLNEFGTPNPPIISSVASPVPTTRRTLQYAPLAFRYDATLPDRRGMTTFGLGMNLNAWFAGSLSNVQATSGSRSSSGHWVALTPSLTRDFFIVTNWTLTLAASGQWASEPLISNEQFGVGGVGSVRGYHEGEAFGSSGWWATAEQKTPPYIVGTVYGHSALSVRGSVYMGYGQAFMLNSHQDLWGVGFGAAASVGANWEARFLFSFPLVDTPFTRAGQPRFDFGLAAQF